MIVCVCHAVSDASVRQLASAGASVREVVRRTRAGTSCGCCASAVRSIVASSRPPCGKAVPCAGCECAGGHEREHRESEAA